jgi:uncharacterized repeat protein (TIGR02543 family)
MSKHLTHLTAALFLLAASLSAQMLKTAAESPWTSGATTVTYNGNGTLTVSGVGAMADYLQSDVGGNTAPWGNLLHSYITKIIIEDGVTYIGQNAFSYQVTSVSTSVTCNAEIPPDAGDGAFGRNCEYLYVPDGSITDYKSTPVWKDFAYINPHTVTFLNGDMTYKTELVSYEDTVTKPADPFYPSLTQPIVFFDGWYKQEEGTTPYVFSTPVTSDITLVAKWSYTTSVASPDRVITQGKPANEAAAVAPAGKSHAEFTAGPNPASRSYGGVAFFRQGSLIVNASLSVYDAYGNLIRALSIRDNAVGTLSKRRVGSWNLKDANGRSVPDGTYLVKGTITAAGGKSQSVSLPVGVR